MFIPAKLIDNQPVDVSVELPAAWIARAFADWLFDHADEFTEYLLANDGTRLEWQSQTENTSTGEILIFFGLTK